MINDYKTWQLKKELPVDGPLHTLWRNDKEILVASQYVIKLYTIEQGITQLVTIAQAEAYGFSNDSKIIYLKCGQEYYQMAINGTVWQPTDALPVRDKVVATPFYRVYAENTTRGSYKNILMVRDIEGYKTVPLFPPEEFAYESFTSKIDSVDFINFRHGSRVRGREVALVFDALESIEGLTGILNTLAEYGLRCTFFVNGEVIRRYPDAVKEIAQSGHEVGSMFYIPFNMTDAKFNINKDFIKSGLARTEDEYFTATGKELSLLWHAPNYVINTPMITASEEMNYLYIGRDIDPMDWVTKDTLLVADGIYLSATKLIERVLEKKEPGSIIPIMIGIPNGERESFLFQKLDLLINGLIKKGYRIVPVSRLIENAK
jgi:peptidoglycan/xylan/chitin deacetylase (PgdA/CDA1 family)